MTVCEIAKCKCGTPVAVVHDSRVEVKEEPTCGRCSDRAHYERQRRVAERKFRASL